MALTKPSVIPVWAESGDKVQPSNAEIQVGWPLTSTPPSRQRFNWILNYCMNAARYATRRGLPDYDATETYLIGDTVIGDDGEIYRSLVNANINFTPSTNPTKWKVRPATAFPSTTCLLFPQAAAPVGWTQITTYNNRALRLVNGTGAGIGGTVAFTTAFANQAVTGTNSATTLTTSQIPPHTHSLPITATVTTVAEGGTGNINKNGSTVTGDGSPTLGGSSHNHTFSGNAINLAVQYLDIIMASKD